ncbi:MAG: hypothetical protein Kapaf2KO_23560 [Candidatus Kapaibacteriales bacterium]
MAESYSGEITKHNYESEEDEPYLYFGFCAAFGITANAGDDFDYYDSQPVFLFNPSFSGNYNTKIQFSLTYLFSKIERYGIDSHIGVTAESYYTMLDEGELSSENIATRDFLGQGYEREYAIARLSIDYYIGFYYKYFSIGYERSNPFATLINNAELLEENVNSLNSIVAKAYLPLSNPNRKSHYNIYFQVQYGLNSIFKGELEEVFYPSEGGSFRPASFYVGADVLLNLSKIW